MVNLKCVKKEYAEFKLNVSMNIKEGAITGLIGQNGAGKSTVFKLILGLIKPNEGDVLVFGKDIRKISGVEKENIGVVLAESGFNEMFTVKDIAVIMKNSYKNFDGEWFISKCNYFKLPLSKKISEFSSGMKAKVKVLLAMSHKAKLLLLDEPTAGLDVIAREEILDIIRDYMKNEQNSVLISSHIATDLEGLCDEIYMIHDGNIIWHEETDVLLSEYGVIKVTEEQYGKMDKDYILKVKKESYGYKCLTGQKRFYMENMPGTVIENGSIDEVITMMIKGDK